MRARYGGIRGKWAVVVCVLTACSAWACDSGTVRDASFHRQRDMHRLCVFGTRADPETRAIAERLGAWLDSLEPPFNARLERVFCDDPTVVWGEYGIPSQPPRLPAVALIGAAIPTGRPFVVTAWEPAPDTAALEALLRSPARAAVQSALATHWAVLLYAQGSAPSASAVIEAARETWAAKQPPGLAMVRLDRAAPEERLLCAFAGIPAQGADWLTVVFGKGTLLAPPLTGPTITQDHLNRILEGLAIPCTCLQQSVRMGLDLPMCWDEAVTQSALALSTPLAESMPAMAASLPAVAAPVSPRRFGMFVAAGVVGAALVSVTLAWVLIRREGGPI